MIAEIIMAFVFFAAVLLMAYKTEQMLTDIRISRDYLKRIAESLEKKSAAPTAPPSTYVPPWERKPNK